ncbi:helix-hairpin-helix domain-containing protein [Butyrivibrio sp. VCB2006]|uniref:helix-hairpin-helix domain-containing protein n=1 Tax=Butyrivibrio sp. VCB2006 TaxID=1280679 RepID=UPI000429BD36|nr:helix-hairpin-helix domain-containing protein [Butyrivibrio sp. VCB2006]
MRNILVVLMIMVMLVGCQRADSQEMVLSDEGYDQKLVLDAAEEETLPLESPESPAETEPVTCAVFVCGAVTNPGVYYLDGQCRIVDVVEAAGGFTENADKTYVNLAAQIQDGLKLQIPTIAESVEQESKSQIESFDTVKSSDVSDTDNQNGLVNINTASLEQLKTLPGIGDGIAGRIIDYRSENGKFSSIEDIMKVSGIKDKLFSKIKDHITV